MYLVVTCFLFVLSSVTGQCPHIVGRERWKAKEPKKIDRLPTPVKYVIIHHTYIPGACNTSVQCEESMRGMQRFHQDDLGWNDIGYNFCTGGDDKVYEGRGWKAVGAHAPVYNKKSIGICMIGDYRKILPSEKMMKEVKMLINCGVEFGFIQKDYKLFGHRQVRQTECPGQRLYQEIQTWPHWTEDGIHQVTGQSDT